MDTYRLLCTILLGVWYLILNAAVLLILLSTLADPDYHHFSSSDLGGDFEFMDDANMCIAIVISVLMILICAMVTYRAYKQYTAWIIPFFCYQIFDFSLDTLVVVTIPVYPNSIQEYIQQRPPDFPYKDDIMSVNPTCSVLVILLFTSIILAFKGYLISCVWNCYRNINNLRYADDATLMAESEEELKSLLMKRFLISWLQSPSAVIWEPPPPRQNKV
ncbi:hypothetical protein JEQ12_018637 [Ovis aries]|uniref:Lysosomal-associated transmembrane protein 4B n=1 Tax=Ovis aries TaxID=9940 RepID=A0A836A418_SHEEP|nr:hypothetical protein JEQ12_018637 [Ovis aries]